MPAAGSNEPTLCLQWGVGGGGVETGTVVVCVLLYVYVCYQHFAFNFILHHKHVYTSTSGSKPTSMKGEIINKSNQAHMCTACNIRCYNILL